MSVRTLPVVHGETNSFVHLSLTIFSLSSNWVLAAVVVIGSLGLTVGEPFLPESGPQLDFVFVFVFFFSFFFSIKL